MSGTLKYFLYFLQYQLLAVGLYQFRSRLTLKHILILIMVFILSGIGMCYVQAGGMFR